MSLFKKLGHVTKRFFHQELVWIDQQVISVFPHGLHDRWLEAVDSIVEIAHEEYHVRQLGRFWHDLNSILCGNAAHRPMVNELSHYLLDICVAFRDTVDTRMQMRIDEAHRGVHQVKLDHNSSFVSNHVFESSCNQIGLDVVYEWADPLMRENNKVCRLETNWANLDIVVTKALLYHLIHQFLARREHAPDYRFKCLLCTYHVDVMIDALWVQESIKMFLGRGLAAQVPRNRVDSDLICLKWINLSQWRWFRCSPFQNGYRKSKC